MLLQLGDVPFGSFDFGARFGGEFRIVDGDEFARLTQIVVKPLEAIRQRDHLLESLVLASQGGEQLSVADRLGIGQLLLNGGGTLNRRREPCSDAQVVFFPPTAYFWRKRSTRPAVSTSFCLPV